NAKLYSRPTSHIPIFMAAAGPESAKASAKYSDGLITFLNAKESQKILDVFDRTIKKDGEGDTNNNIRNSKQKIDEYRYRIQITMNIHSTPQSFGELLC
ncbi:MAG: hypothetical protein ACJ71J_01085, partial [Nitrososphaeraceae archaeon]